MGLASLLALGLAMLAPAAVRAQVGPPGTGSPVGVDAVHNATSLQGTWATGSQQVLTGPGFANPANTSFTYPNVTGVSYSFTDDGHYEIARYRFNANGSEPTCITGVIGWVHGTYQIWGNGSIVMTPFGDGYQQIQDPCAAVSNFIETYNETELYQSWRIFLDPATGGYKLHLFQFDGSPVAPQFQVSASPMMLPTQALRNVSGTITGSASIASPTGARKAKRSAAAPRVAHTGPLAAAAVLVGAALLSLVL